MKTLRKTTSFLAACFIFLLVVGCSRRVEFEGVECIKTSDIFATNMECNWDAYNAKENNPPWIAGN
ncbi:hypothetical protein KAR91_40380 [Candidatus Pacearchaeota archaeon]|nr:hypothetical protein [Candidatus Pacearchaeota archaeon]